MAKSFSIPRSIYLLAYPVAYLFLALALFSPQLKAQTTSSWNDASGHWSNAKDWTPNGVPHNGGGAFYNVVIHGTGSDTITFDSSGTVINSLSLGPGETLKDNGHSPTLTIGDPAFPAAGSLTNGGTIDWRNDSTLILDITAGNGSITNSGVINLRSSTLEINDSGNANSAVLSGGGTVNLSRGSITGAFGDETLTNNDNTIQGSGTIRNLTLVNNGTINANAVAPLTITPNSGGFTNNGTVNVTGLGGLVINAGPTPATNTGTMDVNNSNLTVRGAFAQSALPFPVNALTLQNGSIGTITGAMSNAGMVTVDSSSLTVGRDYNNFGLGFTDVSNSGTLKVFGNFTNNSTPFVFGSPNIPGFSLSGGSSAVISGNFTNTLISSFVVDNSALTILGVTTSDGEISIRNGGTFTVQGGLQNGADGVLGIGGGLVKVGGDMFSGFAIVTIGGGTLTVQGNFDSLDADWVTLKNSTLTVNGTYTNGSPGLDNFQAENCRLAGASFLCLSGPGNVASLHAVQNNSLIQVDAGSSLMVGSGGFVNNGGLTNFTNNSGNLKLGGFLSSTGGFTNNGGTVVTDPGSTLITSTYSQNAGLTDVSGTLVAKSYQQSTGSTVIETGGIVSANTFNASGGTVTVNGILDPTAVEIGSRGTLQGSGIVSGNVFNRGNIIAGTPATPLTFNINGNYTQNATGIFTELIGSKGNGLLNVSGAATLVPGASLNVQLVGGFDPKNGTSFTIMDYGSEKGTFTISDPYFDNGTQEWVASYGGSGGHDLLLTAEASKVVTPEPSSVLLVGTVLLGIGGYAKRKRAR